MSVGLRVGLGFGVLLRLLRRFTHLAGSYEDYVRYPFVTRVFGEAP